MDVRAGGLRRVVRDAGVHTGLGQGAARRSYLQVCEAHYSGTLAGSASKFLQDLRLHFHATLGRLPLPAARRLRHAFQIGSCPDEVSAHLVSLCGTTYGIRGAGELPAEPVPLSDVAAYTLRWDGAVPLLNCGGVRVDEKTLHPDICMGDADYNFWLTPSPDGPDGEVPEEAVEVVEAGLYLHEAMELALLGGHPLVQGVAAPAIFVGADAQDQFAPEVMGPTAAHQNYATALLDWLWQCKGDTDAVRRAYGEGKTKYLQPFVWLEIVDGLRTCGVKLAPEPHWAGYTARLGEQDAKIFLDAVWASSIRVSEERLLVPLNFFRPDGIQDPLNSGTGVFASFDGLRGRDSYADGSLHVKKDVAAIQVVRVN